MYLYNSCKRIDEGAFDNCSSLKTIVWSGNKKGFQYLNIADKNEALLNAKIKFRFLSDPKTNLILPFAFSIFFFLVTAYVFVTSTFFPDFVKQEVEWLCSLGETDEYGRALIQVLSVYYSIPFILALALFFPALSMWSDLKD